MASGEVLESYSTTGVNGGTMLMQRELVITKERTYAYWYAYQRVDHRLFRVYIGSMVGSKGVGEEKGRRRLREKIRSYDPC